MQSLEHDGEKKDYSEVLKSLEAKLPGQKLEGKPFKVENDAEKELIYLTIDGIDYILTRQQALDLSYALSVNAKRIIKKQKKWQK